MWQEEKRGIAISETNDVWTLRGLRKSFEPTIAWGLQGNACRNRNLNFALVISSAFTDLRFPLYSSVTSVVDLLPVPAWRESDLPPRSQRATESNSEKSMPPTPEIVTRVGRSTLVTIFASGL